LRPLAAYVPYLYQRWNEGCRNAAQIHRELPRAARCRLRPHRLTLAHHLTRRERQRRQMGRHRAKPQYPAPPVPSARATSPPPSRPAKGQSSSPKPLSTSRSDNGITWRRSLPAIQRYARSMRSCTSSAPWSAPEAERTWTAGWSVWRTQAGACGGRRL
jgi:hypothetical protein